MQLREGDDATEAELLDECEKHIARYKLPKAFVFVDEIVRSPPARPTTAGRARSPAATCSDDATVSGVGGGRVAP